MKLKEGALLQGGEFKILKKLGQGGFGITYLAQQKSLNRKVAIKEFFMNDCCQRDEHTTIVTVPTIGNRELVNKYKDKFKREAQFTAGLSHPNIVTIYSIFEENETVYYVMEFLSGGSLADYIKDRALSEAEAVEYVKQISDALKLMHSNKENHLDVKPGNIMMRGNGNVVLIDFGLTKVFDEDGNPMTTTSSVATFTPHYAPIEQYKGIKEFSPETDIYSLGATLYRLVVGKVAPEADEILQDGLPSLPEHLSQNVKDAITKSMQPRRSDRPKSINEFIKVLLKNNKSNYTDNIRKRSINVPILFLSIIYFILLLPIIFKFFIELPINIRFALGIEGYDLLRVEWITLSFIITGFIGIYYIYIAKKAGIIWLVTSAILFIICYNDRYSSLWLLFGGIGFLDQGGFPLTITIFIVIAILIGIFGRHQGQSIYSQMTKGNNLANIRNATLICITLLFMVFLSYVNFENLLKY